MQLLIQTEGTVRCVYSEQIALSALGHMTIRRGSHVEPDNLARWFVDLAPIAGPRLGPFEHRSSALGAEQAWLEQYWLVPA
jgi:hypothetical protein